MKIPKDRVIELILIGLGLFVTACGVIAAYGAWLAPQESRSSEDPTVTEASPVEGPTATQTLVAEVEGGAEPTATENPPADTADAETSGAVLFSDAFDDNATGWQLGTDGVINQGALVITADLNEWIWLSVPAVEVQGDFYIEAEMTLEQSFAPYVYMGFALGDGEQAIAHHRFLVTGRDGDEVSFFDNNSLISSESYPQLLSKNTVYTLGLEAIDGKYTFYIDGIPVHEATLTRYGNTVGVFVWRSEDDYTPREAVVSVDNIVVRQLASAERNAEVQVTPNPDKGVLFSDAFDDNAAGWELGTDAVIQQGALVITADLNERIWLQVPAVEVQGDFYIEAEMTLEQSFAPYVYMGFALGDGEQAVAHHRFLVTDSNGEEVSFFDNNSLISSEGYSRLLGKETVYAFGLEAIDGKYTFYVDGIPVHEATLTRYGNTVGVFVWRSEDGYTPREAVVSVDNIVVRMLR